MCSFNEGQAVTTVKKVLTVQTGSETDLMAAVAEVGPVAVAIDHRHRSFQVRVEYLIVSNLWVVCSHSDLPCKHMLCALLHDSHLKYLLSFLFSQNISFILMESIQPRTVPIFPKT